MILAIFDLLVILMLPRVFQINWLFGSGEEAKNRFSRWQPWQPSWTSDLQVYPMLPVKFPVNGPFSPEEEAKNRFSRWRLWWPSWISDWNGFSFFFFLSTSHPDASYQVTSQLAVGFRRRREKQIFKMVAKAAIFDF